MRSGGRHGRPGERSRRLLATLITLILLAMIAGLAVGLAASLGHLKPTSQRHDALACMLAAMISLAALAHATPR